MEVILLERVAKLGQMGETVKVRDGYARNFLLPRGKALRATKANKEHFETQRAQLEARNLERRKEAETVGEKLTARASSSSARRAKPACSTVRSRPATSPRSSRPSGFSVDRNQIAINRRSRPSACTPCPSSFTPRSR